MRRILPFALLLSVFAMPAFAAAVSPPGLNMRWDQCYGDGGAMNKTFACNTNAGSERLVTSFELAAPMADVSGLEFVVSLESASPSLPSWWALKNVGTCRMTSASFQNALPPLSVNCVNWSAGLGAGGIGAYEMPFNQGPNYARFRCAVAVPFGSLLQAQAGVEYHIGSIVIDHAKTVGTGACAGCDVPVCLSFDYAKIFTPVAASDITLLQGANYDGSRLVSWQNSLFTNYQQATYSFFHGYNPASYDCIPYSTTATRPSTWGAVKSLYR